MSIINFIRSFFTGAVKQGAPQEKHLWHNTLEYKGFYINLFTRNWKTTPIGNIFDVCWEVDGHGYYTNATNSEELQKILQSHIKAARAYIDRQIAAPDILNKVKNFNLIHN